MSLNSVITECKLILKLQVVLQDWSKDLLVLLFKGMRHENECRR